MRRKQQRFRTQDIAGMTVIRNGGHIGPVQVFISRHDAPAAYALLARGLREPPQEFEITIDLSVTGTGNLHVEMEFADNQGGGYAGETILPLSKTEEAVVALAALEEYVTHHARPAHKRGVDR